MIGKTVLDNGIRVITEQIPGAHSVTLGIWVENGSRHETAAQNGISHFLEHMLFKGTERRRAQDIAREIDSVGGVLNAFTGREFSCYYAKVLAQNLSLAVDLLSDAFLHSVFEPAELEKERRVILQEIHMVEDDPEETVHDLFSREFWQNHPLGRPVLGTAETVGAHSREALLDYRFRNYCGRKLIVCAAGNVEHQRIVDRISEAFERVPSGAAPLACDLPYYRQGVGLTPREFEQVHICLGARAFPQNHSHRYEAYLLNTLLGSSMSSRLFQTIREERGLAYSVYSYLNCHTDAGALVVYAGTTPGQAREVVELSLREMGRLRREEVSADALEAAKAQLKGNLLLSLESTDNRMTRLANNEIYFGRQVQIEEVIRGFEEVTATSLREQAEEMIREEELHLQIVGRVDEGDFTPADLTFG